VQVLPVEHARRLAAILPDAQLEVIADSRTWVMLDQPERAAELIARARPPRHRPSSRLTWPAL
jgi:pimeloyl-ACP methyl ester carboxylesterase